VSRDSWFALVVVAALLFGSGIAPPPEAPADASAAAIEPARATAPETPRASAATPTPASNATDNRTESPRIAAAYPNPVASGDRGEFVVLDLPRGTPLDRYALLDGDDRIALPNRTLEGRVALASAPATVRTLTTERVIALDGSLSLANSGERLRLVAGNETVARARYRDAPESEIARFDDRGAVAWRPLGATDRPIVTARNGTARAFVLPDSPGVPLETIRGAEDRVLLAGYTFASERIAAALEAAAARGVDVRVLLDGDPIGGISRRQARVLDSLAASGASVSLLAGPRGRYAYHHAKYAVVDDRAVVLTENWKPAGTGGRSSRGWGVVVDQARIVEGLAETFRADAGWRAARPWSEVRRGRSFEPAGAANGSYPTRYSPETVPVERTRLLVTPDNAADEVVSVLDGADDSVAVLQMSVGGPDQRFLRAVLRAARRGVDVRVLLSSAWYVREENRRLVDHLRERADAEDLPIQVKLADPRGRFEKIHAKGVIVDGERVLLGSLNWNDAAATGNREVVLALAGDSVGAYYGAVFDADWGGHGPSAPVGVLAAVGGLVVLAVLVARRIDFTAGEAVGVDWR